MRSASARPTAPLIVGTRGSALARTQTEEVLGALGRHHPELAVETRVIRTRGDEGEVGTVGAFVTALERALYEGTIDVAVHSYKDLPTDSSDGLRIAAVPERADPRDALITRDGRALRDLDEGARIGTGSPRRGAQLLAQRPDLEVTFLQGNVDTRLAKLEAGHVDALVLAMAGLDRLGRSGELITERLGPERGFLPAPAQGALALQTRTEDGAIATCLDRIDHGPTRREVAAERACLRALGGGCRMPIAAYGHTQGERLAVEGLVASRDGRRWIRDRHVGPTEDAERLGRELGEALWQAGADEILGRRMPS